MAIREPVIESWLGAEPQWVVSGWDVVSLELLQVSMFLAAFSGLYFTVYAVSDENYRKQFFDSLMTRARACGRRPHGLPADEGRLTVVRRIAVTLAVALTVLAVAASFLVRSEKDTRASSSDACVSARAKTHAGRDVPVIGVASVNVERTRRAGPIFWADMRRIARQRAVEVIGWQEADAEAFQERYPRLERLGWTTRVFEVGDGSLQVPISWRTAEFELLDTAAYPMVDGAGPEDTTHPFRPKWVTAVTLRHRELGRVLTVMNTHVPNQVETGDQWEDNLNAVYARVHYRKLADLLTRDPEADAVAVGDLQWDHRDDKASRPEDGVTDTFAGRVVSSFEALGLDGLCPTRNTRYIDYVLVPQVALDADRLRFVSTGRSRASARTTDPWWPGSRSLHDHLHERPRAL